MPAPTLTWLLDKNVARRAIEGVSAGLTMRPLTFEQSEAIRLIALSKPAGITLAITPETANILERVHDHHLALERRLKAMTSHLSEPYRLVVLPEIIYPNRGLELLYSIPISDL